VALLPGSGLETEARKMGATMIHDQHTRLTLVPTLLRTLAASVSGTMTTAQRRFPGTVWILALGVGLIATPSVAQLSASGNQLWNQGSSGLLGQAETRDLFGGAVATGDFNGDGYDDLAVGVIGEDIGAIENTGVVQILYGGTSGLSGVSDQIWDQDSPGLLGVAEPGDGFGFAVVAGDFDDDGYDDLAIGIGAEDIGAIAMAGAVQILYGSASGLSANGNQLWFQDSPGMEDQSEAYDQFGLSLAAGDFSNDGYDDLAVGILNEDIGTIVDAGAVQILYGGASGLSTTGNQLWHQDSPGLLGMAEANDRFGRAVAAGDFDDDGYDDLAIGVEGEDSAAGGVQILYSSASGLSANGNQWWAQDSPGVLGAAESEDRFGWALAVGDFDGDLFDDLAIGIPDEDIGAIVDAGAVQTFYGSASGLSATGNQLWFQDSPGVLDAAEENNYFGRSLASGEFNGDGYSDLAIAVPGEDFGSPLDVPFAGVVQILPGRASGLSATGNQLWAQDSPGILGVGEEGDFFGSSLAAGDFSNDGFDDLAIGIPNEDIGAIVDAGAVQILAGGPDIFSDGFEQGNTSAWSATVP